MKQLRILTGKHAGAHVDLMSTRWLISADDEADIQLLDWTSEPMVIEVDDDEMLRFAMLPAGAAEVAADAFALLADFMPRRFGNVVLCAGPADAVWPAEVELIGSLTTPMAVADTPAVATPEPARKRHSPYLLPAFVGTALMTAALGAAVARLGQGADRPAGSRTATVLPLETRIGRALADMTIDGLDVRNEGGSVIVRGLVKQPSDADALRQRLSAFKGERVVHAYAAVTDVAQSITEALGRPGLTVTHRGSGHFVISGAVDDLSKLRESAERVATDLAPLVRSVEVAASQLPPSGHAPLSAALSSDGLQYVQTRDGVKHISVTSIDPEEAVDSLPR
jgi:type III secretion protein D